MNAASPARVEKEGPALSVATHGATDPGVVREENQDAFCILEPPDGDRQQKGLLAVVADGMGGLAGGAIASRIAVEAMREGYPESDQEPPLALKAAVWKANLLIRTHSEGLPDQEPMGCTVTALALTGQRAAIAHVGDSRAYRLPVTGPIRRLTRDHTWVEELAKRGELEPNSLQYSLHRNVLTRALGLRAELDVDIVEVADVVPGDSFILCSDGLHEMVEDVEIEARLRARGADLKAAAGDLIGLARDRGGPDNITVVLVRVGPVPPAETAGSALPLEGFERPGAPRSSRGRLFPRVSFIFFLFAAFVLGVGTVLLLEEPPLIGSTRPEAASRSLELLEQILGDQGALSGSPEAERLREAIQEYRQRVRSTAVDPPAGAQAPFLGPEQPEGGGRRSAGPRASGG